MDHHHQRWNEYYHSHIPSSQDSWLHLYEPIIKVIPDSSILDLGCGNGSNLGFLCGLSNHVYAIDYSEEAIDQVKKKFSVNAVLGDMRNPLPYTDSMFDIIISDLSLHYFSENETTQILNELNRVLKPTGMIFARLNSIKDKKHGAQQGKEIEPYYYEKNGIKKRFFTEETIKRFFEHNFDILQISEKTSGKYLEEKYLWEVISRRKA